MATRSLTPSGQRTEVGHITLVFYPNFSCCSQLCTTPQKLPPFFPQIWNTHFYPGAFVSPCYSPVHFCPAYSFFLLLLSVLYSLSSLTHPGLPPGVPGVSSSALRLMKTVLSLTQYTVVFALFFFAPLRMEILYCNTTGIGQDKI